MIRFEYCILQTSCLQSNVPQSNCEQMQTVSWHNASHALYSITEMLQGKWQDGCCHALFFFFTVNHGQRRPSITGSAGRPSRPINPILLRCKAAAEPPPPHTDGNNKNNLDLLRKSFAVPFLYLVTIFRYPWLIWKKKKKRFYPAETEPLNDSLTLILIDSIIFCGWSWGGGRHLSSIHSLLPLASPTAVSASSSSLTIPTVEVQAIVALILRPHCFIHWICSVPVAIPDCGSLRCYRCPSLLRAALRLSHIGG